MKYRYIVVEGIVGSGKTALAKRLADYFLAKIMEEQTTHNPFLIQFHANASHHALATQLHFLLERNEANKKLKIEQERQHIIISDFLLEKDRIFAPIFLEPQEQTLYWNIREQVMPEVAHPDLLIYLQCSGERANKRLTQQTEKERHTYPEGYLKQIEEEYGRFFHLYENASVLIANTDELDFENNDEHFELLIKTISQMKGKRYYLNLSE